MKCSFCLSLRVSLNNWKFEIIYRLQKRLLFVCGTAFQVLGESIKEDLRHLASHYFDDRSFFHFTNTVVVCYVM
jgi:hypothetical protein